MKRPKKPIQRLFEVQVLLISLKFNVTLFCVCYYRTASLVTSCYSYRCYAIEVPFTLNQVKDSLHLSQVGIDTRNRNLNTAYITLQLQLLTKIQSKIIKKSAYIKTHPYTYAIHLKTIYIKIKFSNNFQPFQPVKKEIKRREFLQYSYFKSHILLTRKKQLICV